MKNTIGQETLRSFRERLTREEKSGGTIEKYAREAGELAAWLGERELTRGSVSRRSGIMTAQGVTRNYNAQWKKFL